MGIDDGVIEDDYAGLECDEMGMWEKLVREAIDGGMFHYRGALSALWLSLIVHPAEEYFSLKSGAAYLLSIGLLV